MPATTRVVLVRSPLQVTQLCYSRSCWCLGSRCSRVGCLGGDAGWRSGCSFAGGFICDWAIVAPSGVSVGIARTAVAPSLAPACLTACVKIGYLLYQSICICTLQNKLI